jgi:hypothetical protein
MRNANNRALIAHSVFHLSHLPLHSPFAVASAVASASAVAFAFAFAF